MLLEFLLWAEKRAKVDLEILSINLAVEVEEMNFEPSIGPIGFDGWAETEIGDAEKRLVARAHLDRINAVRRELFAFDGEVRRGKAEFMADLIPSHNAAEHSITAAEEFCRPRQIADRVPLHG